jgi:hypothetical protein
MLELSAIVKMILSNCCLCILSDCCLCTFHKRFKRSVNISSAASHDILTGFSQVVESHSF